MGNGNHLQQLRDGVEKWNLWRSENPLERIELPSADLSMMDLSRANLSSVDLRGAQLAGVCLLEANPGRANLEGANLRKADLYGVTLASADLTDADLTDADVRKTNLRKARLGGATLCGGNLAGADLAGANLAWANLAYANLYGANLTDVNLTRASLVGANLCGCSVSFADFGGASWGETQCGSVDLRPALGLESVQHVRPSTIGIDTLVASEGEIPVAFLRGCGVPESFIEGREKIVNSDVGHHTCFISCSPDDEPFARRVHEQLQARGIRCWLDNHQRRPGEDLYASDVAISNLRDPVLLCCSASSLKSWWVDDEVAATLLRENKRTRDSGHSVRALLVLDLDGFLSSSDCTVAQKSELTERLVAHFSDSDGDLAVFERGVESTIVALRTGNRP